MDVNLAELFVFHALWTFGCLLINDEGFCLCCLAVIVPGCVPWLPQC
jgi:hypothetical protein